VGDEENIIKLSTLHFDLHLQCKTGMEALPNALNKSERKVFDEMWDIPRLYVSACSNSCQLVPLHPISLCLFFPSLQRAQESISEVEQIQEASTP
jgi:hypothetical protein